MYSEKEREIRAEPRIYDFHPDWPLSRLAELYKTPFPKFFALVVHFRELERCQSKNDALTGDGHIAAQSVLATMSHLLRKGGQTLRRMARFTGGTYSTGRWTH